MTALLSRLTEAARAVATRGGASIIVLAIGAAAALSLASAQRATVETARAPLASSSPTVPATTAPSPEPLATAAPAPLMSPAPGTPTAAPTATPAPEPPQGRVPLATPEPGTEAFAGLSTWIDVYDVDWSPQEQVEVAHAAGVDTIFMQSARYASEGDIDDAERLGGILDAAKSKGIKVMTWYIPDFIDPARDLRRAQAAIAFTSPGGNRADAFGLDVELDVERDVGVRNIRLLELSAALREWAGPDFPMAAIVLPPLQLDLNGTWWPDFPYAELRPFYDVYIPMSYSSYRGTDYDKTYSWNLENVLETRIRAGDPDLPIHLAGGIADNLPEVEAFVAAARDGEVLGAGLYDLHTTRSSAWPALQALRLTPGTAGEVPSLVDG